MVLTQPLADQQPASAASQRHVPDLGPVPLPFTRTFNMTRHQPRVHTCSPARSSPHPWPSEGTGPFGLNPGLRTPQLPATHARAGTGLEHWPEAMPPTSSALQPASSLAPCDLVSHVLGPVIPDEQPHMFSCLRFRIRPAACGRTISALMKQCSRLPSGAHDIPAAISSPGHRQGHDLSSGLTARGKKVLTCRRLPGTESAAWRLANSH